MKLIQNLSKTMRKLVRMFFFLVFLVVTVFASFLVVKVVVHAFDFIQTNWPPILWGLF